MNLITTIIGSFGDLIATWVALWASFLLVVNAFLIYLYFRETRKQAKATEKIVEYTRSEFDPNLQILFSRYEREVGGERYHGVIINRDGMLVIPIVLKNLSKDGTRFSLDFETRTSIVSTFGGSAHIDTSSTNYIFRTRTNYLKPRAELNFDIAFDIGISLERERIDYLQNGIFQRSSFEITYEIEYPGAQYFDREAWYFGVVGVIRTSDSVLLLRGEWVLGKCVRCGLFGHQDF